MDTYLNEVYDTVILNHETVILNYMEKIVTLTELRTALRKAQADYILVKKSTNETAKHLASATVHDLETRLAEALAATLVDLDRAAKAQAALDLETAAKPPKTPAK